MRLAQRAFAIGAVVASLTGCTAADWAAAFQPQPGYVRPGGPPPGTAQCVFCKGYYANVFEHQRQTGCTANRPAPAQPAYQQPAYQQQAAGASLTINTTPALATLAVETAAGWKIFGSSGWSGVWNSQRPRIRATMGAKEIIFRVNGPGVVALDMNSQRVTQGDVEVLSPAAWAQHSPAQPASQPGQMPPDLWAQNAIGRLQRSLQDPNFKQNLAAQIQVHTHPSGNTPSMGHAAVGRAMGSTTRVVATFSVNWRGGVVGSAYTTQVQWIFSQASQESLTVTGDNAPTAVAESNRAQLEGYFRQLYDEMKLQIR